MYCVTLSCRVVVVLAPRVKGDIRKCSIFTGNAHKLVQLSVTHANPVPLLLQVYLKHSQILHYEKE